MLSIHAVALNDLAAVGKGHGMWLQTVSLLPNAQMIRMWCLSVFFQNGMGPRMDDSKVGLWKNVWEQEDEDFRRCRVAQR